MVELWNSFQKIRKHTKSDISKFESAMRKYAKSDKLRKNFQKSLK